MASEKYSMLRGLGGYLPSKVVTNHDLSLSLDTSHEWIESRSGICQRHIAGPDETVATMGGRAAKEALAQATISAQDLTAIIVATSTPDHIFPPTAVRIQKDLDARQAIAFDVGVACSGFLYGLRVADALLKDQQQGAILVIGAEKMSVLLDWQDRSTAVLFGDGAGAAVLSLQGPGEEGRGILGTYLYSDGAGYDHLYVKEAGHSPQRGAIVMNGREVFRQAVGRMEEAIKHAVVQSGFQLDEVQWFVCHQANRRILASLAERLGVPFSKFIFSADRHANTSAASIPLALWHAQSEGLLRSGDLTVFASFGAGFTWGASIVRL
jgi:3-oxoacyl-[acyl-carrier-protein] synthase-3